MGLDPRVANLVDASADGKSLIVVPFATMRTLLSLVPGVNVLATNGNGSGLTGITESQVTNLVADLAAKADGAATTTALAAKADATATTAALAGKATAPIIAVLSSDLVWAGTSSAFNDVTGVSVTLPTAGRWLIAGGENLNLAQAVTNTCQLAVGSGTIGDANSATVGTFENGTSGSVGACVVSTGSPTVISLTSRPDAGLKSFGWTMIIQTTAANTVIKLRHSIAGAVASSTTIKAGTWLRAELLA